MTRQRQNISTPTKSTLRNQLVLSLILLVIIALGGCSSRRDAGGQSEEKQKKAEPDVAVMEVEAQRNIGLRLTPAQSRKVVQTLRTTGSVGPNETRIAELRPLAPGRVLKVLVRLGERVRANQALAIYDNIELGSLIGQYEIAKARLQKAEADAEVSKRAYVRAQNLVEMGALAQAELERRRAESATALSAIQTQRAELSTIDEKLHRFGLDDTEIKELDGRKESHREFSQTTLRAPFNGVIIKYEIAVGEIVDVSRPLFTVADLSTVWVQADLYEKDLAAAQQGQLVKITSDAYPGEIFTGRVTYISDLIDPKTRTARVRCEVPNPNGRLKLDLFVSVLLPTPADREAVMIPEAAVQQINDQPSVFIPLDGRRFQRRGIQLGIRENGWVEVTQDIKAGEQVVTQGSFALKSALLREQIGGED